MYPDYGGRICKIRGLFNEKKRGCFITKVNLISQKYLFGGYSEGLRKISAVLFIVKIVLIVVLILLNLVSVDGLV